MNGRNEVFNRWNDQGKQEIPLTYPTVSFVNQTYHTSANTRSSLNLHQSSIPRRTNIGKSKIQIYGHFIVLKHIIALKTAGKNKNEVLRILFPKIQTLGQKKKIKLSGIFLKLNNVTFSTLKNYISSLRVFIRFLRGDTRYQKYVQMKTKMNLLINPVKIFIEFLIQIQQREDFIEIFWDFLLHKITIAEKQASRGTLGNYWTGIQFFFPVLTNNTHYTVPKVTPKDISKLKKMLPNLNKAADPLDSAETLSTFITEGIRNTAIDENLFFYSATWFSFLAALRPSEAYTLDRRNFILRDKHQNIISDINSRNIHSIEVKIFEYKNKYHIDDTKSVTLYNWPEAGMLNPIHTMKILLHNKKKANHYANAYKNWHDRWDEFWKKHKELHQKNQERRITVGSVRITGMAFMAEDLQLKPEEMKRITHHRSDVLEKVYLKKDLKQTHIRYNRLLQKKFPLLN